MTHDESQLHKLEQHGSMAYDSPGAKFARKTKKDNKKMHSEDAMKNNSMHQNAVHPGSMNATP